MLTSKEAKFAIILALTAFDSFLFWITMPTDTHLESILSIGHAIEAHERAVREWP